MCAARRLTVLVLFAAVTIVRAQDTAIDPLLIKLGQYVASYGEKASIVVAVERYTQTVTTAEGPAMRPRQLVAEFAIVKTDSGWLGYRDVIDVNGQKLTERRDRLLTLFTSPSPSASEFTRITSESARFNVGPVVTTINVPTTTLFFFRPEHLDRFTFTRKGTARIEGVETVEFEFKETARPTLMMKRGGNDVPAEGTLWITPDGTLVRSRLRVRGFADTLTSKTQGAPAARPAVDPTKPSGGRATPGLADPIDLHEISSLADVEVTYARHAATGLWLPAKMAERYEGAIKIGARPPFQGVSTTRATYSDYKQFGTGGRVRIPHES